MERSKKRESVRVRVWRRKKEGKKKRKKKRKKCSTCVEDKERGKKEEEGNGITIFSQYFHNKF